MKYRMIYDLHTHTVFSHGKGTIEDNVKAAVEKGLETIGIADHGPGHLTYGVKRENFPVMRKEVERLKPLYPQIQLKLCVEANIMNPSGRLDTGKEEERWLDAVLAGYHYGIFGEAPVRALFLHGGNLLRLGACKNANTERVLKALYENKIEILTHPGDKGVFDIEPIARACAERGTLMEISTWHKALTVEDIRICAKTQAEFVISSDAHTPERVGTFEERLARALEAGLVPARIVNIREI